MSRQSPVTVVVGDDHPMYRAGVVAALKESGRIQVLAEVGDGRAALDAIREHAPAVALLDYRMPELDGLAVVAAVTRDELPTHVLLLSATEDPATVYEALAAGAAGYLTKESDRDEIVAAVISCASGAGYVPTGKPTWIEFLELCLQRRPPGFDRLFAERPGVVAFAEAAADLTEGLLPGFGGEEGRGTERREEPLQHGASLPAGRRS